MVGSPYGGPVTAPTPDRPPVVLAGTTREAVLGCVRAALATYDGPLRLEGHGAAGVAALSLALHQRRLGLEVAHVTCVSAAGEDDPVSGRPLGVPTAPRSPTTVDLVAGEDPASRAWTAATVAAWRAAGWTVSAPGD
jgi:hypothetical protein